MEKICNIKAASEKSSKAVTRTEKTTACAIRNKNTQAQDDSQKSKLRTSRRLQGIEPEVGHLIKKVRRKSETSVSDDKEESNIQIESESSAIEKETIVDLPTIQDIDSLTDTQSVSEKVSDVVMKTDAEPGDSEDKDPFVESDLLDPNKDDQNESIELDKVLHQDVKGLLDENDSLIQNKENALDQNEEDSHHQDLKDQEDNFGKCLDVIDKPSAQSEQQNESSLNSSVSEPSLSAPVVKPKKKTFFSGTSRNKVEYNMDGFFELDLLDEEMGPSQVPTSKMTDIKDKTSDKSTDDASPQMNLKRIKKAYQCHDLGETEQFDADIKYYLSGILNTNQDIIRSLRYVSFGVFLYFLIFCS